MPIPANAKTTTDHDEVRSWVEERGGRPVVLKKSGKRGPDVVRIDMPGYNLKRPFDPISWERFFAIFDERGLGFLHQERTVKGELSLYNRFMSRKAAQRMVRRARQNLTRRYSKRGRAVSA